jgi:glycine cleavage system H protein
VAVPTDRKYSKTHEWYKAEGNVVTVGISEFAANQLTDITYVQLPAKGTKTRAGGEFGEVESVKATSPLYSAVAGEVIETNEKLNDAPETVNQDAFGAGWMIKIKTADLVPLNNLMDPKAYEEFLAGNEH